MEDETRSKLLKAAQFKTQFANVVHKNPFEPQKSEHPIIYIKAVVLNIMRTANEREVFNEMIRSKHAKVEELMRLVSISNLK